MIILRGVIVISMKEDSDAWIIASSGAVDQKQRIVQVRAQVMCWDNSTGLWGRSGGGGISNVCLFKFTSSLAGDCGGDSPEFFCVQARRINDDNMLLDCQVTKDLEYTCVNNSMLHHWFVGGQKFGLTFQSPSEASQFHEAIRKVLQILKNCASLKEGTSALQSKDPLPETRRVLTKKLTTSESREKSISLHDLCPWNVESPPVMPFIPEEDQELIPPPKMIHSTSYGFTKMPKKPRAKTPPASPSQIGGHHLPILEEPSSSHKFREHHSLHQLSDFQMQPASQSMTNEYLPSPHRMTLSSYRYNDPTSRSILLKNEQDLAEKATLVVEAGSGRSLWRRNSLQSMSESYVHLTKNDPCSKHDYSYPTLYSVQNQSGGFGRSPSNPRISSVVAPPISGRVPARDNALSSSSTGASIPLPKKSTVRHQRHSPRVSVMTRRSTSSGPACVVGSSSKVRCLYCQEYFTDEEISRGICKDAPDKTLKCIKTTTCFCCAEAALYHCAGDGEDHEFESVTDERSGVLCSRNCKRSIVLALVCMFVPCLWCYPVLRACHRCAVRIGWTGPRHRPV